MGSEEIFDKIEEIAATSSKLGKIDLISRYCADSSFAKALRAALDPTVTYGVKKIPTCESGNESFGLETDDILNMLALRELTGSAAEAAIIRELGRLSEKSGELFKRILKKDLRAGFSASSVNKAVPGSIPTFDCMLAHKFDRDRIRVWPQVAEPKLDGVRVLAFIRPDAGVKFFSRSGKEFETFEHLKDALMRGFQEWVKFHRTDGDDAHEAGIALDGEIVSGSFNKTVGDVRRKFEQAVDAQFHVFDLVPLDIFSREDKGGCRTAGVYDWRRLLLTKFVETIKSSNVHLIPRYLVNSFEEIDLLYEKVRKRGLEGLIIKEQTGYYHRRRNHAWMKIKAEESVDVRIVDAEEGTGKYEGMLGALIVDFNGVKVNVGTGLSDEQRKEFWDTYMRDSRADSLAECFLLNRLCEIQYHEVTPDGSLRHPVFVRFRDDKDVEEGVVDASSDSLMLDTLVNSE